MDTFAGSAHTAFSVSQPIVDIVAGLNRLQPVVLSGYPSALAQLVDEARAGRLCISPRLVVTGAEPLLPETRTALKKAWGAGVRNWYGCSEVGPLAVGCARSRGLHLSEDLAVVEPVDDRGRQVAAGQRASRLYLTNLYNPVLPLIRYELTDEVTVLDEHCPCGCAMRLIADPQGRLDDVFLYDGIRVHPHVFRSVLARRPEVLEYQVRQTATGAAVAVRSRGPVNGRALAAELACRDRSPANSSASFRCPPAKRRETGGYPRITTL
jgi:phenylacetate-CoA ligase